MADISPHVREFLRDFYDAFSEGKVYGVLTEHW